MAGGDPIGCAARKKSKNKTSNYSLSSENGGDMAKNGGGPPVRTTRGGLRVYKIVILGDGGVGKSGKCIWLLRHTHTHTQTGIYDVLVLESICCVVVVVVE